MWNLSITGKSTGTALPTEARIAAEQLVQKLQGFGLKIENASLNWEGNSINVLQPTGAVTGEGVTA
jgi:hypothetical protein